MTPMQAAKFIQPIATINLPTNSTEELFCVYAHATNDPSKPVVYDFIGMCAVKDLTRAPDAWNNRKWLEHIRNANSFTTYIMMITANEIEASRVRFSLIGYYRPLCNTLGYETPTKKIRCIETGEIFDSQNKCALAHNIQPGNLSRHLNRVPGHRTIRGRRYERI